MFKVYTGTTEEFFGVNADDHVRAWRWYWFKQGITIRKNGVRYDNRTGNPISAAS